MSEQGVPEGQLPRDERFWNTHFAVLREHRALQCRFACALVIERDHRGVRCASCDLTGDELMITFGMVREGDKWVRRS